MTNLLLAKRYAKAIFNLGKENGQLKLYLDKLYEIRNFLKANSEIYKALISPIFPFAEKKEVMTMVADALECDDILKSFLDLLVERSRVGLIELICNAYQEYYDEELNVIRAKVKTAVPLSEELQEKLRQTLIKLAGRNVEIDIEEDPSIIGGLVVKMGDKVWDGSIKTQLENIRQNLIRGEIR